MTHKVTQTLAPKGDHIEWVKSQMATWEHPPDNIVHNI